MSSFPLHRLSLVALRNVVDCWDPIELYEFSKVSEKTKTIVISLSKIPQEVKVCYGAGYYIQLKYQNKNQFKKRYKFDIGLRIPILPLSYINHTDPLIPRENPSTKSTIIFGEVLEIFKSSINRITLSTLRGTDDEFKYFISWINSLKQEVIPEVLFLSSDMEKLGIFLKNFEKVTDKVIIEHGCSDLQVLNEPIEFSRVKYNSIQVLHAGWLGLQKLMAMDFVEASISSTLITSRAINTFLKSWLEGKSHERMKKCVLTQLDDICIKTILEEVSIENQEEFDHDQVQGILKIQGNNGKIAEIQFNKNEKQLCIAVL